MIRSLLCLFLILAAGAPGAAQGPKALKKKPAAVPALPAGPPPTFMLVSKVDLEAKQLTLLYRQTVPTMMTREVEVEIDGKTVRQPVVYTVMRMEDRTQILSLETIEGTAGGKAVEGDDAWKALRGRIVLVTMGAKLDAAYAELLNKNTVVIEVKPAKKPQPEGDDNP